MTTFNLLVLRWMFYIISASFLLYILEFEMRSFLYMRGKFQEQTGEKYVLVLDGGSTGTRVNVFFFSYISSDNITFEEDIEVKGIKIKPELASFVYQPQNAVQNITYLLEWAKSIVPVEKWNVTPLTLRGTAALRALPKFLSSSLFDEINQVLQTSPFYCPNRCISLLTEEEEGIYGWYALNYLIERLNDLNNSAALIETGGGSFQVTFSVDNQPAPKVKFINSSFPNIKQKPLPMYTRSYLGLGFLNARFSFLQASNDNLGIPGEIGEAMFISSCIQPHHAGVLHYNNVDYIVIGQKNKNFSYEHCYQKVVNFLGNQVEKIEELNNRDIYVAGINSGLSYPMRKDGDYCTLDTFVNTCKHYCSVERPYATFLCFDCTYMAAFLIHGLGLDIKKEIKILNKIDGIPINWCLGVALNMLI